MQQRKKFASGENYGETENSPFTDETDRNAGG